MLLTGESPPSLTRVQNALDHAMEEGTEFGPTPVENLLGVAAVVLRDLEQAGFTADEVREIARHLHRFTKTVSGGRN